MKLARAALAAGENLLDRVLCALGAVLFSQAPEFMQQYLQRLGGHLDEARRQLAQFHRAAEQSGLALDQLIHRTAANPDPAVARLSAVMADAVARVDALATAYAALADASMLTRPFVFLRHADTSIAGATWAAFRPAVPTTVEGLAYALLGMAVLLCAYYFGLKLPVARAIRVRRARLAAPPAPSGPAA